jgi:shikimate dehydrogenase
MNRYGLIGYPLSHSFSKNYFTKKFEEEGLTDHCYELFPIKSIDEIRDILKENPDLKGLNVTIPYKQLVLQYLDDSTNLPKELSACNCIKIINGKLYGYNTDVIGFERSLIPNLKPNQNKALILGNGGATAAVKYVFDKNNIECKIVSRKLHDGSELTYQELTKDIIKEHLIIVNTTPLGMYPQLDACPDIPYDAITADHYLFDLTYNPEKTLFLQKGEEKGATIQNGSAMLVIQAEESWNIWQANS